MSDPKLVDVDKLAEVIRDRADKFHIYYSKPYETHTNPFSQAMSDYHSNLMEEVTQQISSSVKTMLRDLAGDIEQTVSDKSPCLLCRNAQELGTSEENTYN